MWNQDIPKANILLDGVSRLAVLQELFVDIGGSLYLLWETFRALTSLQSLERFTVVVRRSMELPSTPFDSDKLDELSSRTPCRRLTHVHMTVHQSHDMPIHVLPFIEWLTRPREDYRILDLSVEMVAASRGLDVLVRFEIIIQLINAIRHALPHLKSLELHAPFPSCSPDEYDEDCSNIAEMYSGILRALGEARNLRWLLLCNQERVAVPSSLLNAYQSFSRSLEVFSICRDHSGDFTAGDYNECTVEHTQVLRSRADKECHEASVLFYVLDRWCVTQDNWTH
jgi:hypothetical protein